MKARPRTVRQPRSLAAIALPRCTADYLADCRARNLGQRTMEHYQRALDLLAECLPPSEGWATAHAIRHAVAALQERGYAAASLNMYLRAWKAFLRFCQGEELIQDDLARLIRPPKTEPRSEVILDAKRIQRLIAAAREGWMVERDTAILLLLFDTGLRAGELCALEVRHVDLGARVVTVPGGKTGGRTVPIGRTAGRALRAWLRAHPTGDGPLFPSYQTGEALSVKALRSWMYRLADRSGIPTHPHAFRHSFSVNYLRNSGDTFTLQRILGHSTLTMTRWYAQMADADVQTVTLWHPQQIGSNGRG
jgi:site-specific recombinase XerD